MSDWPKTLDYVGKEMPRLDGPLKVTGKAKYASDQQPAGWLYGMILRSKWAATKIHALHLEEANAVPGIKAIVTIGEGERQTRYYGEELAAVAGTSKQACLDALRLIKIEATPLPFSVRETDAMRPDAARVFEKNANLGEASVKEKGHVDQAFASAAAVVEGYFTTPVQIHHSLETHGNTVSVQDGKVTAWASTQGIFSVREGLAGGLNVPQSDVRVICDFMGGGFGAKFGPGVEGLLAGRLSQKTGAPVKLMLTRFDQSLAVGNRPSSFQKVRLAADKDGKLLAYELDAFGTSGIGSGGNSAGGGGGAGFPAPYLYEVPNTRVKQAGVAVNAGSSRAMRAPGHPQASFSMESIMDDLAVKLGLDPVDLRLKNDPFPIRQKEYAIGRERFGWKEKYRAPGTAEGVVKTGVGCAGGMWGGGGRGTRAEAKINPDGTIEVRCGTQDLGTGTRTVIGLIAAEVFGVEPQRISALLGDTDFPPSGGSGGSSTMASVSPAIFDACSNALKELQTRSGVADARGANFAAACRKLNVTPVVAAGEWREGLSGSGTGGVQFAEVEVDTETGFVKVRKIVAVHDCGLVMNKLTCESQINGGITMGLGYALYEQRIMDRQTGVVLNPNFETYKLPNGMDIPDIDIVLLDMPERGTIGIAESSGIPTASAIANAVANAIGVRVCELPITPDKVLAALGKVPAAHPASALEEIDRAFHAVRAIAASWAQQITA